MFADLLLSVAIVTSAPAVPGAATVNIDRAAIGAGPSCIKGPVKVRFRTDGGTVQIAAHAIRVEGMDHPAEKEAQPE